MLGRRDFQLETRRKLHIDGDILGRRTKLPEDFTHSEELRSDDNLSREKDYWNSLSPERELDSSSISLKKESVILDLEKVNLS